MSAAAQFAQRSTDKLGYRYPRGESYLDVIQRLDPLIHELERQTDPVVIVGHQVPLTPLFRQLTLLPAWFLTYQFICAPMHGNI